MKLLRIPKLPKFKFSRSRKESTPKRLQARMRTAEPSLADGYDDEEPQTKLTSAFIVVLILHVVAVGGIYAFNQIKASRRGIDAVPATAAAPAVPVAPKEAPRSAAPAASQPARTESAQSTVAHTAPPVAPMAPTLKQRVYNVKPGDNLVSIAKSFSVPVADLKAANGLSNDMIRPGQVLNLPNARPVSEAPAAAAKPAETGDAKPALRSYTVKSGDRLIFIAKKCNVTQEDLIALNKIKDPTKLQIGQTLKVPAKKTN